MYQGSTNKPGRKTFMALAALMALTRFHHGGSEAFLPDASLAVFFLAGMYWGNIPTFIGLMVIAVATDIAAIGIAGASSYCLSPAYGFLAVSYSVMGLAGYVCGSASGWLPLLLKTAVVLPAGTVLSFLISSYSFYLFSGKVRGTDWIQYGEGIAGYFPNYLTAAVIYCAIAFGIQYLLNGRDFQVPARHAIR